MASSSQIDREERFRHLLQPIRDIAQNWDVDIATSLEDYLEDLENITISLDGGVTNVNFAEAALLIQGSTNVYSRKVEHVYQLVLQTIELLTQRAHSSKSSKSKGSDDQPTLLEDAPFLLLDDLIEEGAGIDLDPVKDDLREEGVKVGSQGEWRSKSSTAGKAISRPPMFLMDQDYGSSFKMSSCAVDTSGALLIEGAQGVGCCGESSNPFLSFDSRLHTERGSSGGISMPDFWGGLGKDKSGPGIRGGEDHSDDDSDDVGGAGGDSEYFGQSYAEKEEEPVTSDPHRPSTPKTADGTAVGGVSGGAAEGEPSRGKRPTTAKEDTEARHARNPWALLDPHNPGKTQPKPVRKGRLYRLPKGLKRTRPTSLGSGGGKGEEGEEQENEIGMFHAPLHGLACPEFDYIARLERRKRALQEKISLWGSLRGRDAFSPAGLTGSCYAEIGVGGVDTESSREARDYWGDSGYSDDLGYTGGSGLSDDSDDNGVGGHMGEDGLGVGKQEEQEGGSGGVQVRPILLEDAFREDPQTYEDLVRSHIEAFMRGTEQYAHETQLSRRVRAWQNKLEPLMQSQDERVPFDIHAYGKTVLERVTSVLPPQVLSRAEALATAAEFQDPLASKTNADKSESSKADEGKGKGNVVEEEAMVPFSELVSGRDQVDICRLFLASLQLANHGNIRLHHGDRAANQSSTPFELELVSLRVANDMGRCFRAPPSSPDGDKALPPGAEQQAPTTGRGGGAYGHHKGMNSVVNRPAVLEAAA
ncbi:unnamed protein product [Discosporangium mesarthrocarpum]